MTSRIRTLIIGCDYQVFHSYTRYFSQTTDHEICGFVSTSDNPPPPEKKFKVSAKIFINLYSLSKIEDIVKDRRVEKVIFLSQNLSMTKVQSIIIRLMATCRCSIEFLPVSAIELHSFKPVIAISSLSSQVGKSLLGQYICAILSSSQKKVSIIIPYMDFDFSSSDTFSLDSGKHIQLTFASDHPPNIEEEYPNLPSNIRFLIQQYSDSGANRLYLTTNILRAIIQAEQHSDIIIYDSYDCEAPPIHTPYHLCATSKQSILHPFSTKWPGLLNLHMSNLISVNYPQSEQFIDQDFQAELRRIMKDKKIFGIYVDTSLSDASGQGPISLTEMQDKNVLIINSKSARDIALKVGANIYDVPPVKSPAVIPQSEPSVSISQLVDQINQQTRKNDCDYIVTSVPLQLPNLDPGLRVLIPNNEIHDPNNDIYRWIDSTLLFINKVPPLQKHFAAQVDILNAMAAASDSELSVMNNDSSNREAFCRLFLASHLSPSFRVTTGEIIDAKGNKTGQLDVVIVNAEGPRFTIDSSGSIIAPIIADNVLGVVEVKTSLTKQHLCKALDQMRPVKSLMPSHATLVSPEGKPIPDPLGGKIITGIFAFNFVDDDDQQTFAILKKFPNVVDFVVIPGACGYFNIEILKVCGFTINRKEIHNGYVRFTTKGIELALIFAILNSLASIRRFSGSNCLRYIAGNWGDSREEQKKNISKELKSCFDELNPLIVVAPSDLKNQFFLTRNQIDNDLKPLK